MPAAQHTVSLPSRYRVARRIASGGMATVYACEDQVLGRLVAVKVLAPHFAGDAEAVTRFEREARAAAKVSDHPHVVTIYDIGEHEGQAFIVMEYFPGGTVADRLKAEEPVPGPTALRWLGEAASALDHAHAAGIVHRDVKPANLLVDANGRVAVADFGIARLASDVNVTSTGVVLGTAAYLSPEQATGRPATTASDRYALGVVAFELLCGRKVFEGDHPAAQARAHLETPPPRPSEVADVPPAVDRVLWRALEKDPERRWASACDMVDALEDAMGREAEPATAATAALAPARPVTPTPPPPPRTSTPARAATPPPRRRWGPVLVAAVIIGVLAGGAIAAFQGGGGAEPERRAGSSQPERTSTAERTQTEEAPAAEQPAEEATPPAPAQPEAQPAEGGDSRALAAEGHSLLGQGEYDRAVEVLQRAVQDCPVSRTDPCAYALFDLGVSLTRAGRPEEAIPVLERRLENPDQRGTVQKALNEARRDARKGGDED
jgi:eukaryotic-like serine/threonine-protein kinase